MNILVTGAKGFIGKNLISELRNTTEHTIFEVDMDTTDQELSHYCEECHFVYHLAGINRPETDDEFMKGNFGFTSLLLDKLASFGNKAPILITSSIQAELDNLYGKSKLAGEECLLEYSQKNKVDAYIFRLPNVFGKWSRPNYNSAVATFCYSIARGKEITINNAAAPLRLVYIDDVVESFLDVLKAHHVKNDSSYYSVATEYQTTVGQVADLIQSFKDSRETYFIPNMEDELSKKLYSTYLSFLPENDFAYPAKMNVDHRGSFTELFKTMDRGQVSVNISKPGITKGQHWHHTKNEKFVVVQGQGVIRFRKIGEEEIIDYPVSGEAIEIVDIPVGYTHSIVNTGDTDMVTVMWANEAFDPNRPDTYFLEV